MYDSGPTTVKERSTLEHTHQHAHSSPSTAHKIFSFNTMKIIFTQANLSYDCSEISILQTGKSKITYLYFCDYTNCWEVTFDLGATCHWSCFIMLKGNEFDPKHDLKKTKRSALKLNYSIPRRNKSCSDG